MSLSFLFRFSCVISRHCSRSAFGSFSTLKPLFTIPLFTLASSNSTVQSRTSLPSGKKGFTFYEYRFQTRQDRRGLSFHYHFPHETFPSPTFMCGVATPRQVHLWSSGAAVHLADVDSLVDSSAFSSSLFSSGQLPNPRCTQISTVLLSYCLMDQECITQ